MFEALVRDSFLALPFLGWVLLAIILIVAQLFCDKSPRISVTIALTGLVGLLAYSIFSFDKNLSAEIFSGTAVVDPLSQIFNLIGLAIVLGVVLMLLPGLKQDSKLFRSSYGQLPEFLICLLLSGFGLSVLASALDLTSLFLGLETLSIGLYCLCGFYRTEIQSTESAFKYLLIGAFSTAIFLYGIAFIYGATGFTQYAQIAGVLRQGDSLLAHLGIVFLVAGFAFKLAFVPFHLYTADVYEGAPTPVTGYLTTIVKVGVLAAGLRIFWGVLQNQAHLWVPFWISLCVLSILIGNIVALQQRTFKKLLAFSSISHSGFMGLGLLIAQPQTGSIFPLISYLIIYSSMSIGLFALLTYVEERESPFRIEDLKGLGQQRFGLSLAIGVFILGMAGIPPFAGFMIKFWILQGLIQQGYIWVAVMAIIGSAIGAAYYLRILMYLFISEEKGRAIEWSESRLGIIPLRLVAAFGVIVTLIGGVYPQLYANWILNSFSLR